MQAHGVGQRLDHTEAVDAPSNLQREARPTVLIAQRQDAQASPVMGLRLNEVEAPDVVAADRSQPFARAVGQPEAAAGSLSAGTLSPLRRQMR